MKCVCVDVLNTGCLPHRERSKSSCSNLKGTAVIVLAQRLLSLTVAVDNWDVDEHAGETPPLSIFMPQHYITTYVCCVSSV